MLYVKIYSIRIYNQLRCEENIKNGSLLEEKINISSLEVLSIDMDFPS